MDRASVVIGFSFKAESVVGFLRLLFANNFSKLCKQHVVESLKNYNIGQDFVDHYWNSVFPHIELLEKARIDALQEFRLRSFITLLIGSSVSFFALSTLFFPDFWPYSRSNNNIIGILIFLAIIAVYSLSFWASRPISLYKENVRTILYPPIIEFFGKNFSYKDKIDSFTKNLERSCIVPIYKVDYNVEFVNGYIKGNYSHIDFEIADIKLGNDYVVMSPASISGAGYEYNRRFLLKITPFLGDFIVLTLNKRASSHTICKKGVGNIKNWFLDFFGKFDNVQIANLDAYKDYKFYSDDIDEAKKLLTKNFIEKLEIINGVLPSNITQCSFYDDKLLIMIPSKKSIFRVASAFLPPEFVKEVNILLSVMENIFGLIEVVNKE